MGASRTISDAVDRFLNNTTAHGLPRISNARNQQGKLFWILVWMTFFSVFGIQAFLLYAKFREKHPSTNVKRAIVLGLVYNLIMSLSGILFLLSL